MGNVLTTFALRATIPLIQSVEPAEQIHLLPLFDAYTIGVPRDCEPLLAQAYKRQVFNLQGWTFAVVLVNGSIQGIWHSAVRRLQIIIKVNLFSSSTPSIRKGIEAEAERLSHLLGKKVLLEYESVLKSIFHLFSRAEKILHNDYLKGLTYASS
jgi:hypothetical protein